MLLSDNDFYDKYYIQLNDKNNTINGKNSKKRIDDNIVNLCRDEYFNFNDLVISNSF